MGTTNGNLDAGAPTDLVDLVGGLDPSHNVGSEPEPEPVKKATARKSSK